MIAFLKFLLKKPDPVIRRYAFHLKLSNLLLEAQIFRLQLHYIAQNIRITVLEFRVQFRVWVDRLILFVESFLFHDQ